MPTDPGQDFLDRGILQLVFEILVFEPFAEIGVEAHGLAALDLAFLDLAFDRRLGQVLHLVIPPVDTPPLGFLCPVSLPSGRLGGDAFPPRLGIFEQPCLIRHGQAHCPSDPGETEIELVHRLGMVVILGTALHRRDQIHADLAHLHQHPPVAFHHLRRDIRAMRATLRPIPTRVGLGRVRRCGVLIYVHGTYHEHTRW
jgi:hypothetical protein